jgi:uncharacterized protein (DUF2336 family)
LQAIQAIVIHEREAVVTVQGRQEQLKRTVMQRLKWAAGANPVLAQTLQLYEEALEAEHSAMEVRTGERLSDHPVCRFFSQFRCKKRKEFCWNLHFFK